MNPPAFFTPFLAPGRPRNLLIAALAACVLLAGYLLFRPDPEDPSTAYHEVRRGNFTVSIVEGGTLAAISEVSIRNEVEGTSRIIYIVPEGSYVRKDDLLVELDSSQAQDQFNQQQINVEKAQFALIQAQAQLDIQRSTTNSDIRAGLLRLDLARLDLEKFERGQRLVDLVEASNKLVQAQAQLSVNLDNYHFSTNLAARGYETQQKVDSDRLAVLGNQNSLIVASNQIWMLQEFDLRKQLTTFRSNVEEAEKELERIIAQSVSRIAQYQADLLTQSNTLVLSQRKLDRDRKNLESARILAPQDGLVVYPVSENRFSQESLIEEGAVVRNRQELIKLPDTSRMKITVKVHESHVNNVRPNLPAFVILDILPDTRFNAYVDRVALLPDTQARWGNPNLKVYNTEVFIRDSLPDVKPGASARVEIVVTNIANTLSVPIQAVTTLRGKQVVYTGSSSNPKPRPVEVGLYNTKFIQIVSGIEEGDRVLLSPPLDTSENDIEGGIAPEGSAGSTNAAPASPAYPDPSSTALPRPANPNLAASPASQGPDRANPNAGPGAAAGNRPPGGGGFDPQAMMRQYDKDGDGQLDESEREAMRAAFAARAAGSGGPGAPGSAPDTSSPGAGGFPRGPAADPNVAASPQPGGAPRFNREEMMRRFDTDGDGELSESERNAMREAFGGAGGGQRNRGERNRGEGQEGQGPSGRRSQPDPSAPAGNP